MIIVFSLSAAANAWAEKPFRNLDKRLKELIESSPAIARSHVGFEVTALDSGGIIAEQNAHNLFTPASNTKLYTTALALMRLGSNYKFQTQLRTTGAWNPGQTALSDLQIIGGGDPALFGHPLPYRVDAPEGDPLAPLEELADKLVSLGIQEIAGDVTAVSTRYPRDFYPDGWTIDDAIYGYGAPITALAISDNVVNVAVHPSTPGELARIELNPGLSYLTVVNQVTTDRSAATQIQVLRTPGSNELVLWGTIGKHAPPWKEDFAVDDPASFAAAALVDVLRNRGIAVRGAIRTQYCGPNSVFPSSNNCVESSSEGTTVLAMHESPPLAQTIQFINKVSDNLEAEMLLREVAHVTTGQATLGAGLKAREDFLSQLGIGGEDGAAVLADGSGLARQSLTTPHSTVALLRYMWGQPDRKLWLDSLPIGGFDGTLQHRFHNMPKADRIHAKTGSYAHVNTLSGYIETDAQGWLAFSIMVNATACPEAQVRDFLDSFCGLFIEE